MNTAKEHLIVIIPAYEPPREFIDYAKQVTEFVKELVVINDGSGSEYDNVFQEIAAIENVSYITYGENHGKGYALKEAFRYCAEHHDPADICVTADCDGQHSIKDIIRVAKASEEHPGALILGSRNFDLPNVPKRSKAGNRSIRRIFRLLHGIDLYDTQTGLRGFPVRTAEDFLNVHGNRFEYEMNMLIHAQKRNIPIWELPIETIYPEDPADHVSHYKAFQDSVRILGTVIRNLNWYLLSSALSAVLDVLVFFLMSTFVLRGISAINTLIATVTARVTSSLLNFALNRKYVFEGKSRRAIYRYYILWGCQLGASYGLIFLFGNILRLPMTPMKLAGDVLLAIFSYQIQRRWVFKNDDTRPIYGPLIKISRGVLRALPGKYRCDVLPPEEPTVYVCRHLDMHGPKTTLVWLKFHVHPMVLHIFFDRKKTYDQYTNYTFTERKGKKKKKHHPIVFLISRIVPAGVKSIKAIPVYRDDGINSTKTLKSALEYLKADESIIVYPDIDYTAGYEKESELYEGFLLLGQLYKRTTGKSLRFVPLYIDETTKTIKEYPHICIDKFRQERAEAYQYIKSSINGKKSNEF